MLQLFVLPPHKLPTGGKRTRTAGPTYERARFGRMPKVKFALDSPLEGSGFELSVPLRRATTPNRILSLR